MRILLICAGGMSSGLLMRQMRSYFEENGIEGSIDAVGMSSSQNHFAEHDVILIAPQVAYRLADVTETSGLPVTVIPSFDYASANCENIMKLVYELLRSTTNA